MSIIIASSSKCVLFLCIDFSSKNKVIKPKQAVTQIADLKSSQTNSVVKYQKHLNIKWWN